MGHRHVLAIDRSAKAIAQARGSHSGAPSTGTLQFRQRAVEQFELSSREERFDFSFAVRVGALDGRHPDIETAAKARIEEALKPGGQLFIDGGWPLRVLSLDS
jgi:hypothetical protein